MAVFTVPNIKVCGIAGCVPQKTEDNQQNPLLTEKERNLFIEIIGIRYRKISEQGTTAADFCFAAAEKLIHELNWNKEEIKILVLVTQTPDYLIPNSSSILQEKLKLPKNCLALDINLGCSGYVYGLSVIGSLLQNIIGGKALLLVGDVSTQIISKRDKSTYPLFSDAGTATALEFSLNSEMHFNLQTDGKEFDDIIVPHGGFRNRANEESFDVQEYEAGIVRSNMDMKLDGIKIFNFALREVAPNIHTLLQEKKLDETLIDYFIFHQANLLILESVRKKLRVPVEKSPYSLYDFGNTSSASIPITLLTQLSHQLRSQKLNLLLSGFGVGLSWGSVYLETEKIICPPLIEL